MGTTPHTGGAREGAPGPLPGPPWLTVLCARLSVGALWLDAVGRPVAANGPARELALSLGAADAEPDAGEPWGPVLEAVEPLLEHPGCDSPQGLDLAVRCASLELALTLHRVRDLPEVGFLVLVEDQAAAGRLAEDRRLVARARELPERQGSLVHGLRSPMNSLALNLDLLLRVLPEPGADPAQWRLRGPKLAEHLQRDLRRMDQLLGQLLDSSGLREPKDR